ncbi:hypothetical protein [Klebsiella michiganensis]|uniref:hypothetical protein n=1 Tax=Klebsiella michiganensis TaxID=1134687 RepID=UPI00204FF818|nr:hypothetical protein [Klebsiella michiganensis]MDM4567279.1 hypothetical protein [Klebsiella michiganensis]MDM4585424.1 hypothetical protein [Klebsiella michiganensis]DAN16231.1 MAG TPA: hypothetical protein [Caudoviricetes sp.]
MKIKLRFMNTSVALRSQKSSGCYFSGRTCQQTKQSGFISDCLIVNNRNDGLFFSGE